MITRERLIFYLSILLASTILSLGGWWLYLIYYLDKKLSSIALSQLSPGLNIKSIIYWEGGTFIALILLLTFALLYLYYVDIKRTKSLKAFLASVTHELKTPLASMRLQAEVINNSLVANGKAENIQAKRLIEDSDNLELQFDKILQLSRIELGGNLSTAPINLPRFLNSIKSKFENKLEVTIKTNTEQDFEVMADEASLSMVFKNLFENSVNHSGNNKVVINIESDENNIIKITYSDNNQFQGDIKQLGTLFYKHNSPKGSGIGLYLSKKILKLNNGHLEITTNNSSIIFTLFLKSANE